MYSVSCLTFILPMADSVRKLCVCVCMCVLFIINVLISMYLILSVILSTVCHFMYLCLSMICILITSYLSPCFNRFSSIWNHFVGVQNILYALNVLWWSLAWILLIVLCDCLHISIFFFILHSDTNARRIYMQNPNEHISWLLCIVVDTNMDTILHFAHIAHALTHYHLTVIIMVGIFIILNRQNVERTH